MTEPQMTPREMVEAYIKLRDYKKKADDEFKKSMERVNKGMAVLESKLLAHLHETEANNVKTDDGTVYVITRTSAKVENPEEFLSFCRDSGLWEALDVRANKKFVEEHTAKAALVPGVKLTSMQTVGVRRPTK